MHVRIAFSFLAIGFRPLADCLTSISAGLPHSNTIT